MKNILPLIILLSLSTTGFSQFWKSKPAPKPTPVAVVKPPIQEAKNVVKELNLELQQAKNANTVLKEKLVVAENKVKEAEVNTEQVQKNADALKNWGIEQQNQAFRWMEKHTSTLKKYHRLKNIAAIVAGLFGAMLGMFCMRFVPPVYAAYAFTLPIAGAVLAFSAVWVFL
jgi:VIT1/CCC1 family predicted Fe2+/Mn2+ transporter